MSKTFALINSCYSVPLGVLRWAIINANPLLDEDEVEMVMDNFRLYRGMYNCNKRHIPYTVMRCVMDDLQGYYW